MTNFEVGMYVRYMDKVWIVDSFYEDMMFLRNMDDDNLAVVLAHEYDRVEVY
jgi:hypothetical protein